jgi:hypothetical protein
MSSTAVVRRREFSPEFGRKVWVDRTSLELTDELTFEEWVNLGEQLTEVGDSMAWWVGDWIEQGTVVYGGKYADALEVMALDLSTLKSYAYVARRFSETFRRRNNLSWSHHEAVASLVEAEQDAFLDAAVKHEWSVRDLRDAIRDARALPPGDATITLERLTLTVPEDRAERWKHAADEAGLSFQEWCATTLDEAVA